ncbi:hypothetical protein HanOQP8_Chr04g0140611 [Helianthus annuus]|nr:hypothetical protein HanLR1_Chr04g0132741 [Helianthus annuus]KAJ0760665.1 hypothetical protein HanOQP8_Chr04g0140611 [Helianthus annuus]
MESFEMVLSFLKKFAVGELMQVSGRRFGVSYLECKWVNISDSNL